MDELLEVGKTLEVIRADFYTPIYPTFGPDNVSPEFQKK